MIVQPAAFLRTTLPLGIDSLDACQEHLAHVDGVMIGRAAYHKPWLLAEVDHTLCGAAPSSITRAQVVENFLPYVQSQLTSGERLVNMSRHILGLYHSCPGGRLFRRYLSENAHKPGATEAVIATASNLAEVEIERHQQDHGELTSAQQATAVFH